MIIDKDTESYEDTSQALMQTSKVNNRWSMTCTHAISAEASLKVISTASGAINKIDVIILDSNVNETKDINYLTLLRMFRSVFGESILIGVLFPALSLVEESFRLRAVKAGVDFIWAKPITQYMDMLSLLLDCKQRKDSSNL